VRSPRPLDELLEHYHMRWPKAEGAYQMPPWAEDEARQVDLSVL